MGSLAPQFTDAMEKTERIELGVKSERISAPMEKKGFKGKKKEVDHVKIGYRGKKNQF
jgi:hypothetical protein